MSMHRLLDITNLFLILTSPKRCRDRQKRKRKNRTVSQNVLSTRMGAVTCSSVFIRIASIKE